MAGEWICEEIKCRFAFIPEIKRSLHEPLTFRRLPPARAAPAARALTLIIGICKHFISIGIS